MVQLIEAQVSYVVTSSEVMLDRRQLGIVCLRKLGIADLHLGQCKVQGPKTCCLSIAP